MAPLNAVIEAGTFRTMQPPLDLGLLRTLVAVAEVSSITRAAKLLGLTQSTVSLQIQRLEERLGVELLERSQRGVTPTAAGGAFLVYARRILALGDEAIRSVEPGAAGQIRLGITDVDAVRYLPQVLESFAERFPEVRPSVTCDVSTELIGRFERGELDVCLSVLHTPSARGEVLGSDEIVWVCGELELDPDAPVPLALYPEHCAFRSRGLRALAGTGRSWEIVYTSQSTAAIDVAIDRGWAVAIKSARALDPGWRVLGEGDGLPPLAPVEVELRRTPAREAPWITELADLLAAAVGADLG